MSFHCGRPGCLGSRSREVSLRRRTCGWRRGRAVTPGQPAACWLWRLCWRGWIGRARPRPAGWTGRPFGSEDRESVQWTVSPTNGFTAATRKVWRGAVGPPQRRAASASGACTDGGPRCLGRGRAGPGEGQGGPLATAGFPAPHCRGVRGRGARAHSRHVSGGAWVSQAVGSPAASRDRSRRAGKLQRKLHEAGAAATPEAAQGRPLRNLVPEVRRGAATGPGPMADARVGQQGTLTPIRARRSTRPRAPGDTSHQWAFAGSLEPVAFTGLSIGAVCPARGAAAGLVLPLVSTEALNAYVAEIPRTVAAFVAKTIPRMVLPPASPHATPFPTAQAGMARTPPLSPTISRS